MSFDDSGVFHCYNDLWKTAPERAYGHYQGIDGSDNRNTTRIRVGAGNGDSRVVVDKPITDAFGNRFFTPLDFELLDVDASYHIGDISLEYDMVTLPQLARMIDNQYKSRLAILYDPVLRHRKMTMDKSRTLWNINLNVPARSMKGILMLFENVSVQRPFARNTEAFYNPQITKVEGTIEGIPNQLYSQGKRADQMWNEAKKYFAASPGSKRHPEVGTVAKDRALADINLGANTHCGLTSGQAIQYRHRFSLQRKRLPNGSETPAKLCVLPAFEPRFQNQPIRWAFPKTINAQKRSATPETLWHFYPIKSSFGGNAVMVTIAGKAFVIVYETNQWKWFIFGNAVACVLKN